jgi:hypothetical protein
MRAHYDDAFSPVLSGFGGFSEDVPSFACGAQASALNGPTGHRLWCNVGPASTSSSHITHHPSVRCCGCCGQPQQPQATNVNSFLFKSLVCLPCSFCVGTEPDTVTGTTGSTRYPVTCYHITTSTSTVQWSPVVSGLWQLWLVTMFKNMAGDQARNPMAPPVLPVVLPVLLGPVGVLEGFYYQGPYLPRYYR